MRNIAIIPARSGSKGLKNKNIKLLNGRPLIAYSIEAAYKCKMFDTIMLSTDSEEYAEIGKKCGADVPFLRSKEMSSDTAGSWDTVKEVLYNYEKQGKKFDTVALLQPTSPLRTPQDIMRGYELMNQKNADSITAVCEMDHSPLWSNTLAEDLSMKNFEKDEYKNLGRQQLPTYYRINGALYLRKIQYGENGICLLEKNEYALIMERAKSIDIDTELDFKMAEIILQNGIQ